MSIKSGTLHAEPTPHSVLHLRPSPVHLDSVDRVDRSDEVDVEHPTREGRTALSTRQRPAPTATVRGPRARMDLSARHRIDRDGTRHQFKTDRQQDGPTFTTPTRTDVANGSRHPTEDENDGPETGNERTDRRHRMTTASPGSRTGHTAVHRVAADMRWGGQDETIESPWGGAAQRAIVRTTCAVAVRHTSPLVDLLGWPICSPARRRHGGRATWHCTNPNLQVDGLPFAMSAVRGKVRRGGYRT